MHIEIREKNGSKKYYLALSFRDGNRVKKVRVFLGRDLTNEALLVRKKNSEAELKQRVKEAKIIHDPFFTVLSPIELNELETLEARGELRVRHLSESDWTKFKETFTYDTNAIEGSRIEFNEVKDILKNKGWPQDKGKEDIAETFGVSDAIDYIRSTNEHISTRAYPRTSSYCLQEFKTFCRRFP